MSVTRRLARPMLSSIFITSGIEGLRNPAPMVEMAEPQASTLAGKLGLPTDPELLVKINAGVHVGAGALLAIGKFRRLASLALLGTLVPTTWAAHRFWEIDDPAVKAQQQSHFFKNLGLIGGLVLAAVDTEGAPSLGWRARRRASQAGTAVAMGSKLTGAGGKSSGTKGGASKKATKKAAKKAAKAAAAAAASRRLAAAKAADVRGRAAEVAGKASEVAGSKAGEARGRAVEAGGKARDQAARSGRSAAATAIKVGGKAAKVAAKTAAAKKAGEALIDSDIWSAGADRAGELISTGARRAGEAWSSASEHLPIG